MTNINFNPAEAPEPVQFTDPKPGFYHAQIDESELCPGKADGNEYIKLRFAIMDGPYANQKVYTNLNWKHTNPQAVSIAQSQMRAICEAVGHAGLLQNTQMLHSKPLIIKIAKGKATEAYPDPGVEIKGFFAMSSEHNSAVDTTPRSAGGVGGNGGGAVQVASATSAPPASAAPPAAAAPPVTAAPPAAAPPAAPAAAAPPPAAPAAPAPVPAGPRLTAEASKNGTLTYDSYIKGGWTDEQLRSNNMLEAETPPGSTSLPPQPFVQGADAGAPPTAGAAMPWAGTPQ